jgi:DNA (cytosine-5)-methyltransferase 1
MAEALGWVGADRPARTLRSNYGTSGDPQDRGERNLDEPTATVTSKANRNLWTFRNDVQDHTTAPTVYSSRSGSLQWSLRNGTQANACTRKPDEPAGTIFFAQRGNAVDWVRDRPATTVCGDPRIGRPGHKDRDQGEAQFAEDAVRVTVREAAILQGFPADYPWQGTKTQQYRMVGDAVPPPLAAAVLRQVLDHV